MHLHLGRPFGSSMFKAPAFAVLLCLHVIVSFVYISYQDITFDEPHYMEYSRHWLFGHPERTQPLDDSKSPVVVVTWAPRFIKQLLHPGYHATDYGRSDERNGRYMMMIFSLITALYVYWWCRELYGKTKWLLPLLLMLFDPLYLSYSVIITTDIACGAFLAALLYHFRKYIVCKSRRHFYMAALFTGLGIITKQSLLFIMVLLPLLSFLYHYTHGTTKSMFTKRALTNLVLYGLIIVVLINVVYYFHRTCIPFGEYVFKSNALQNIQHRLSFLKKVPVPIPEPYVQSIDLLELNAEIGGGKPESTYHGVYLFGELKTSGRFWYYYLVLFLYKIPLGTLLLFCACIPVFFLRFRKKAFVNTYQFLLIPAFFYWCILSFINPFQMGIRHSLLIFPLLYIGSGYLFRRLPKAEWYRKLLAGMAVTYNFISVGFCYPYLIAYTNELAGDKATLYRKIADTSIDYGQSHSGQQTFLSGHPGFRAASPTPAPGQYIVSMYEVCNTYSPEHNPYQWYNQLEPSGHYRYVFILYNVKESDLKRIKPDIKFPLVAK